MKEDQYLYLECYMCEKVTKHKKRELFVLFTREKIQQRRYIEFICTICKTPTRDWFWDYFNQAREEADLVVEQYGKRRIIYKNKFGKTGIIRK